MQRRLGLAVGADSDALLRWLSDERFLTPQRRATREGVRFLANLGFMHLHWFEAWEVMPKMLGQFLEQGPLFCGYYWRAPRQGGHAVVIYGASAERIYFMDPAPGRGLVDESPSFFAREASEVVLGTSLLGELNRELSQTLGRIS